MIIVMKPFLITSLLLLCVFQGKAQSIIYHSMKDFVAGKGDTVHAPSILYIEKRGVNRQLLKVGGDYGITANRTLLRKGLRNKYFAVKHENNLYVN